MEQGLLAVDAQLTRFKYQFPSVVEYAKNDPATDGTIQSQVLRIAAEVGEALRAAENEPKWRVASELMDVMECAETALRMLDMHPGQLDEIKYVHLISGMDRGHYV